MSDDLKILVKESRKAEDKEILLGIEGNAASLYFSVFDDLILGNKQDFKFMLTLDFYTATDPDANLWHWI